MVGKGLLVGHLGTMQLLPKLLVVTILFTVVVHSMKLEKSVNDGKIDAIIQKFLSEQKKPVISKPRESMLDIKADQAIQKLKAEYQNFAKAKIDQNVSKPVTSTSTKRAVSDAPGIKFIGVGYDLLNGNPDGEHTRGGIDPGINIIKRILLLTPKTEGDTIPEQVSYARRTAVSERNRTEAYDNRYSYQQKLKAEVSTGVAYNSLVVKAAFAGSAGYQQAGSDTEGSAIVIFDKEKIQLQGEAGYKLNLSPFKNWPVSDQFAAAVCLLPADYAKNEYKNFLEEWGTHVITSLEFGIRETERRVQKKTDLIRNMARSGNVALSGSGSGPMVSGNLSVSYSQAADEASQSNTDNALLVTFKVGSDENPEPISLTLTPIYDFVKTSYFTKVDTDVVTNCPALETLSANLNTSLEDYPGDIAISAGSAAITMPLTWPLGDYGLPMAGERCPDSYRQEFRKGSTIFTVPAFEALSPGNHFPEDTKTQDGARFDFCTKRGDDPNTFLDWPNGKYCIYQMSGSNCPAGFELDFGVYSLSGTLDKIKEEGEMVASKIDSSGSNIVMNVRYVCCRNDGDISNEMILPINRPFYLIPSGMQQACQKVKGMTETLERIDFDFRYLKYFPVVDGMMTQFPGYYCYYEKKP